MHFAIKNQHIEIVKFIIEQMKVDIRMALALTISVDEYSEVLEQLFPNQAFQNRILDFDGVEKSFQELNEEC